MGTLSDFLKTPDLAPYYKVKAYITLSSAEEEEDLLMNLAACRFHLNKAGRALAECKDVYKDAGDVQCLQMLEAVIEEEQNALLKRAGIKEE